MNITFLLYTVLENEYTQTQVIRTAIISSFHLGKDNAMLRLSECNEWKCHSYEAHVPKHCELRTGAVYLHRARMVEV